MRVNIAIPEAHVSKPVLDAALEAVTRLNEQLIDGGAPTSHQLISQGAKWRPEPPGQEHFDHANILAHRGWGDCDDWAPLHAATLRKTGEDRGAKAVVHRSGPSTWHAVVERSNGKIDDPSRAAGMGAHHGIHGAVVPLMSAPATSVSGAYIVRPNIAIRPTPNGYQGRVDLPWHWREKLEDPPTPTDYAMTALHTAPVAATAIVGALEGAIVLGEAGGFADPDHIARLAAISAACQGCPPAELAAQFGPEHAAAAQQIVGSFFGNLMHAVTAPVSAAAHFVQHPSLSNLTHIVTDPLAAGAHLANPLLQMARPLTQPLARMVQPFTSFIPGFGQLAHAGLDVLQHGVPENFAQLAQMGARQLPGMIPGGGMLQAFAPQAWPMMGFQ